MESRLARRSLRRSDQYASKQQEAVRKKYDLSKWKYAELRDTINTSVGGWVGQGVLVGVAIGSGWW